MPNQNETLTVPQGMTQEQVIELWNGFSKQTPERQEQLAPQLPLFNTFKQIKDMGADVQLVSDVEVPGEGGGGASLALRIVGMGAQGLGALTANPIGIGAGMGVNVMANAAANVVDASQGQPTEALPFSQVIADALGVKNPFTTGNPIADAGAEGMIDALTGMGLVSKLSGVASSRIMGKGILTEYVAKRLDKSFVQDLQNLENLTGETLPLPLKLEGVGGGFAKTLSSVTSASAEDTQLLRDVTNGLTNMWRTAFKLDMDDSKVTDYVIDGFNIGVTNGKTLKTAAGLLPEQKTAIVEMARFNRTYRNMFAIRDMALRNFQSLNPVFQLSGETAATLKNAQTKISKLNLLNEPKLKNINKGLEILYNKMVNPRINKTVKDARGTRVMLSPEDQLLDTTKNKDAPGTILELINAIDTQIGKLDSLPATQAHDVEQQLLRVRDSLNNDIQNSLNAKQRQIYDGYRGITEQINSTPQQILNATNAGEFSGFMETVIRDRGIARRFMEQGIVSKDEAATMAGEYLFQQGKVLRDNGEEVIDFVKIKQMADDPKLRDGLLEMLGSEKLQLLRQFANVAANTTPTKSTGSVMRHALVYSPLAGGAFVFFDPVRAATGAAMTVGLAVKSNQFLKNVLFNPKIGRQAIDMLKMGDKTPQARKAYNLVMSALNGHEAAAIYYDQDNKPVFEDRIVIRQGVGGQPSFQRLQ